MNRRNGEHSDPNGPDYRPIPNSLSGVPYRDATPGTSEIPLDELDCFVIPAQDQNHISEPIHFRIPPYLNRYCKIAVMAGRFPYLGTEDLFRHAIARHIHWLCSIRESIPQHIRPSLDQAAEVCADDEMKMQVEQLFEKAEERVKYHMARGDQVEVIRLLTLIRSRMSNVHDSARMREYRERFERTYGSYLRANMVSEAEAKGRVMLQGLLPAGPEGVQ